MTRRCRRRWRSAEEHLVGAAAAADLRAIAIGGCGKMAALGVGHLAAPLDSSVLKPNFDLRFD